MSQDKALLSAWVGARREDAARLSAELVGFSQWPLSKGGNSGGKDTHTHTHRGTHAHPRGSPLQRVGCTAAFI